MFFTKTIAANTIALASSYSTDVAANSLSGQYQAKFERSSTGQSQLLHPTSLKTSQAEFDWAGNRNAFQRLRNLLTLEKNWDSYGAQPFLRPQVARAFELYSDIYSYYLSKEMNFSDLAPFIAPCSNGAILFEWAGQRFPSRDLEIFVPSAMEAPLEFLKGADGFEEEGTFITDEVSALLDWIFAAES
jgi:hypothetical protein